ncbi:MAG: GIDE domain-containing protein [Gammaproteobacteria bacterium]|nr:GIDE domain-containing protein [Gammaproteobacteria bacterium]
MTLPDVAALPDGKFWFWTVVVCLLTLIGFYFAFRNLARARIIEDTPTSRIRSAHQGYVELSGEAAAMPGEPILSPLTKTPCCWFRYKIERKGDKGWQQVKSGKSDGLFLLRDGTGECIIDPEGADVSPNEKNVWYGGSSFPTTMPTDTYSSTHGMHGTLGLRVSFGGLGGNYRYTEETIYPGSSLYAIGLFNSFGEADRLTMREDLIKARLSQWKADHALLLQRFDRDGNGQIDMVEWEVARRTAKREVTKEQLQEDQQPMHTLSQTNSRRRPFLISAHAEFDLVKRFRYFAMGSIGGFFIFGGITTWLLVSRFTQ